MSTVPLSASEAAKLDKDLREAELPADLNIPDNYVDYTLKNTKPLPPVTWDNWWKELNYLITCRPYHNSWHRTSMVHSRLNFVGRLPSSQQFTILSLVGVSDFFLLLKGSSTFTAF
jgi:hypothetical protein